MSELEKNESSEILNVEDLLSSTIFNPDYNSSEVNATVERETEHIEMGSTTTKNLSACSEYIKSKGIEANDPSRAIEITTLRVLKLLPGIAAIPVHDRRAYSEYIFSNLVKENLLPPEREYLRTKIGNSTLDQILREKGAPVNIQRHITTQEMKDVFTYVMCIYGNIWSEIK